MKYFVLILCVLSISLGQVLFKLSANTLKQSNSIMYLLLDPAFIAAVTLYGITTFGWVWSLQEVSLGKAYLFMSLAYILVPILGWFFFKEVLTLRYMISVILIMTGIIFSIG